MTAGQFEGTGAVPPGAIPPPAAGPADAASRRRPRTRTVVARPRHRRRCTTRVSRTTLAAPRTGCATAQVKKLTGGASAPASPRCWPSSRSSPDPGQAEVPWRRRIGDGHLRRRLRLDLRLEVRPSGSSFCCLVHELGHMIVLQGARGRRQPADLHPVPRGGRLDQGKAEVGLRLGPRRSWPDRGSVPWAALGRGLAIWHDQRPARSYLLRSLAYTGFLMNLINLLPVLPLGFGSHGRRAAPCAVGCRTGRAGEAQLLPAHAGRRDHPAARRFRALRPLERPQHRGLAALLRDLAGATGVDRGRLPRPDRDAGAGHERDLLPAELQLIQPEGRPRRGRAVSLPPRNCGSA